VTATRLKETEPRARTARRILDEVIALIALPLRRSRRPHASAPMLRPGRVAASLLAAAVVVALAMLLLDGSLSAQTKRLPIPFVDVFNEITDFGKGYWFLVPSGILIIALAGLAATTPQRFVRLTIISLVVRFEFVFIAIALPGLVFTIVKRLIGRLRPSALGPFVYVPFSWRPEYASMPSGHSTTAFAAAVALGAIWPRARPLLWFYAVVIAASRVIIYAHYPSDVIAGACLGGLGALIVRNYFAARRLGFAAAPTGHVHVLPGPSLRRIRSIWPRLFAPAA
jgi:membrane-associated phospholipid phosphatase